MHIFIHELNLSLSYSLDPKCVEPRREGVKRDNKKAKACEGRVTGRGGEEGEEEGEEEEEEKEEGEGEGE